MKNFISIVPLTVSASFTDILRDCGVKKEADSVERWARSQQEGVPETAQVADNPTASHSPESQVGHKTFPEQNYCDKG